MSTPNPRRVYEDLREIEMLAHHDRTKCGTRNTLGRVVSCLACEYAWLHSAAYERTANSYLEHGKQKHSHGGARAAAAEERDNAEVVLGPDSVGALLVQKEAMRRDLQRAYKDIDRAAKALRNAESALISAQKKIRTQPSAPSQVRYPRTASADDVTKSQEAQARRRERNEGIA